ncbi:MAG: AAA family ATPase [Deltaproteobacteria bacterium]|jgi:chromosome segregation protein|nr:AAA family ATPase [Deltaproteobacteria bacterium]
MQITRLEIFGFKSFVDRFVLNLDKKFVGIVGPNGCGKSNIVDALRWVLGETSAKQLRGGILEDLIFNGSDARRPLGMCEVSVTLKNNNEPTAQTFTVISGGIDEIVNIDQSTLLDSNNIFKQNINKTEFSNPNNSSQQYIDKTASSNPNDLSQQNANVANGIITTEDQIANKHILASNITDIPGIFSATEVQLTRRLYRSGESEYFINKVPCRLSDMVEFYRFVGLGARGLSIVQQGQISQILSKKPIERRELLEEAAGISGFRARIEVAQRKLEKTSQNLLRISDVITEVEKQVRSLKKQATRAEQRAELKARLKELDFLLFNALSSQIVIQKSEHKNKIDSLAAELEELQNQLLALSAESEKIRADLHISDTNIVQLRSQNDILWTKISAEKQKENQIKIEGTRIEEQITSLYQRLERLHKRRVALKTESQTSENNLVLWTQEIEQLKDKQTQTELSLAQVLAEIESGNENSSLLEQKAEIEELSAQCEKLSGSTDILRQAEFEIANKRKTFKENQNQKNQKQLQLARIESEIATLNAQLEEMANLVVKQVNELTGEAGKVFAAGITVPEVYQTAINAVLGDKADFLVHADYQGFAAKYPGSNNNSKVKFGVMYRECPTPELVSINNTEIELAPSALALLDLLQIEPEFLQIAGAILGNVFVVNTLAEAIAWQEFRRINNYSAIVIVTKSGEVVTHWGWFTTDGKGLSLSWTRRIKEQTLAAEALNNELLVLDSLLSSQDEELKKLDQNIRELKANRELFIEYQRKLNFSLNKVRQTEQTINNKKVESERRVQGQLRAVLSEVSAAQSKLEFEQKKIAGLQAELLRLDEEEAELKTAIQGLQETSAKLEDNLKQFQQSHTGGDSKFTKLQEEYYQGQTQLKELETARDLMVAALSEKAQSSEEYRRQSDKLLKLQNNAKLTLEKGQLELTMLCEEIERNYPEQLAIPSLEAALTFLQGFNSDIAAGLEAAKQEQQQIRSRIEREGEVDSSTIELYKTELERLTGMQQQSKDLESAKTTLENTIKKLKEISKAQFLETYEFVSKKFEQLIPQLFGGGSGHLTLINPDDPLTSGVEIAIRPPGKKLKSLDLMSGGEKALSAIGLLFSVFLYKPNPICVLDEVDAPLDEANLSRFLELIKGISKKTQFLVITHNKQTMVSADRLIGITMQEKGISTALSVNLEQTDEFLNDVA